MSQMESEVISFKSLIDYSNEQIRSRMLSKKLKIELPIVVYAADQGESISAETTDANKLIQVIEGSLMIKQPKSEYLLKAGEFLVIYPDTLHEIYAETRCKFVEIETN